MKNSFTPAAGRFGAQIHSHPTPHASSDEAPRFAAGDTVMHPSEGVCSIRELRSMEFSGAGMRLYYVLKPAAEKGSSTVYLPVSRGNTLLRRLLSRADIVDLIRRSTAYDGLWITDSKQRKEAFSAILSEGNYAKVIRMILEIRRENALRIQDGRKTCAADESILAEAERLLHQEFSCVLNLSADEISAFIARELETCGK